MKLIQNVTVTNPLGNNVKVSVEKWCRPNSQNETWIIQYKGRRITPYEQRMRGWSFGLSALFVLTYGDNIQNFLPIYNPFMQMMPKHETKGSLYHTPVILGLESMEQAILDNQDAFGAGEIFFPWEIK